MTPTARAFYTTREHVVYAPAGDDHLHGPTCGHPSLKHAGQHVDYLLEDGRYVHAHEGHWDECDTLAPAESARTH